MGSWQLISVIWGCRDRIDGRSGFDVGGAGLALAGASIWPIGKCPGQTDSYLNYNLGLRTVREAWRTGSGTEMSVVVRSLAVAGGLLIAGGAAGTALAQKIGGTLKISFFDNPASMSLHEEATGAALRPMMGVFNNLVMYRQDVAQNSPGSIVPDLATGWSWNEEGTELTLPLRQGDEVTTRGDYQVAFHLKRPQPAFLALLASGWSPVYPCHVSPRDMRQHPIGTGPFKIVEFKPNEVIRTARNPDDWKPERPYLDGVEWLRTGPGRSSFTPAAGLAGSPM
jgi:ABC-type transport system substrate-binding protein